MSVSHGASCTRSIKDPTSFVARVDLARAFEFERQLVASLEQVVQFVEVVDHRHFLDALKLTNTH